MSGRVRGTDSWVSARSALLEVALGGALSMTMTWDADLTLPVKRSFQAAPVGLLADRYRIGDLIGRGSSGQVHQAWDERTESAVAIKFVDAQAGWTERQLHREVAALRLLRLPGVVQLLDTGVDGRQAFLVMQLLSGGPFNRLARKGGWEVWGQAALSALQALARIHRAGVVHRDIKPSNLLLDASCRPFITDFGLAMGVGVTPALVGRAEGTPRYAAPEQRAGFAPKPRVDVYSFGVMLAEMLEGCDPPALVARVVASMAALDPSRRPVDAVAALAAFAGRGLPVH